MSTIVTDTITGKSTATTITIGSTPVVSASANSMTIRGEGTAQTSIQQGLCKMWINWNMGGTAGVYDSFNLSSLTDNATGNATLNINNDMANNDYSVVYSGNTYHFVGNNSNKAVGSCQVTIHDSSNNATDVSQNDAQVNGDLA